MSAMTCFNFGGNGGTSESKHCSPGHMATKTQALLAFLQTMSLEDGPQLIEFVRTGDWHRADPFEILSLIDAALTTLREQHGLPPFDDARPDEEPTAFLIIREMFR